jgi:small GTP-binding protein
MSVGRAARVGKSSIISQFLYDKFLPRYRETVEELHRGEYELQNGASLTLDILDTSGAYQFPAMRALSISTADAFILVYSIDDADTWEEVRRLRDQVSIYRVKYFPLISTLLI